MTFSLGIRSVIRSRYIYGPYGIGMGGKVAVQALKLVPPAVALVDKSTLRALLRDVGRVYRLNAGTSRVGQELRPLL